MLHRFVAGFCSRLPVSEKFKTDAVWNIASMAFCGIAGLVVAVVISKHYGPDTLGLFNLAYALFILLSQLAVGGVHFSILHYAAQHPEETPESRTMLTTGLMLTLTTSLIVIAVTLALRIPLAGLFRKPELSRALLGIVPGLFFLSLNKSLLAFHNARRYMKSYAVFQALRSFFLLAAILALAALFIDGSYISAIFSISEFLLLVVVVAYSARHIRIGFAGFDSVWLREHFRYGVRAAFGNLFAEINSRTDIIVLGLFASSRVVGIYSFPATLADGFNQLSIVVRSNINPVLTGHRFRKDDQALASLINKGRRLFSKYMIPAVLLSVPAYPLMIYLLKLDREFYSGTLPYAILAAGCMASIGYRPFLMIPNQTGFPGHQSLLFLLIFVTNVSGNLIFVLLFGMVGAAIGTSLSLISAVFYLKWIVRRSIGINI